jgi:hypothetical protein
MSKNVNVKVARGVLIDALKKSLDTKIKEKADSEKENKDYEKAVADFKKSVPALLKSGKVTIKEVTFRDWRGDVSICAELVYKGALPKQSENEYCDWKNKEAQQTLSNAIRVLELSSEDYVRTSSYGAVAQYL